MMASTRSKLVERLHQALLEIEKTPYPYIPNPPGCKKRASVACIIRINPVHHVSHLRSQASEVVSSNRDRINEFFAQDWAKYGDPEILFIRRAARTGDRWTSQVALPGGKRDPDDNDDHATSVRETQEEVGLDLRAQAVISVGNLPGRIITTEWGTVPLMVLNPYVYLITEPEKLPLILQPAEIASAHWVPVDALLDQSLWTYERADMSDRYAKKGGRLMKYALRALLGQMLFGAIRLRPAESIFAPVVLNSNLVKAQASRIWPVNGSPPAHSPGDEGASQKPLLLWGLTHGIIIDLLRLMPYSDLLSSWRWPTFSAWDVRFVIWLVSLRFRSQKLKHTESSPRGPFTIIEEGFATVEKIEYRNGSTSAGCLSYSQEPNSQAHRNKGINQHSAVHFMLSGYFDLIQKGIYMSMALRTVLGIVVAFYLIRRRR